MMCDVRAGGFFVRRHLYRLRRYVTQSAGRISRALFEISLKKGWASLAERMLTIAKVYECARLSNGRPHCSHLWDQACDKRQWWTSSPLRQFPGGLGGEVRGEHFCRMCRMRRVSYAR